MIEEKKESTKLVFDTLEFIALEGGGGKGAVYKGAIEALELLFYENWMKKNLRKVENGELVYPSEFQQELFNNQTEKEFHEADDFFSISILDYYSNDNTTKIKGISGSSAGAITAFPLALGLNSEDIKMILNNYPFNEEFLPNNELHVGKYRMVGMDASGEAKILIAEDHLKRLGENNIEEYHYSGGTKNKIGSSLVKGFIRNNAISLVVSIILTGLKYRIKPVQAFIERIQKYFNNPNFELNIIKTSTSKFLKFLNFLNGTQIDWVSQKIDSISKNLVINFLKGIDIDPNKWKTMGFIPSNHMIPAIGNIIWDRGIYSGFEVRDFFFKVLLLALSKDTHFRRGFIKSDIIKNYKLGIGRIDIEKFVIKFNDKFEAIPEDGSKNTLEALAKLPELLTFSVLNKIINLNLSVCVTNMTTNQPIYFSNYFTPDFPVLEAVGASMNFPICFKPTYNEANVMIYKNNTADFGEHDPVKSNLNIHKESFSISDYKKYLNEVLNFIKTKDNLQISTNGNLSFRSFLPYLRRIIEKKDFDFNGKDMQNYCYFYYNSAFKGLLIDGGVTNNLPTSIFTFNTDENGIEIQNLDVKLKTLSLKLDNSFPAELKDAVMKEIENDKSEKILERLANWKDKAGKYTLIKKIKKDMKLNNAYKRSENLQNLDNEVWVKICKEIVEEYYLSRKGFTPWNKQVNAISGLMDSLQFGFDQGQIENIEDNENIIPLYCYGIGTMDFDLTSGHMKPLVEIANKESKKQVLDYFSKGIIN